MEGIPAGFIADRFNNDLGLRVVKNVERGIIGRNEAIMQLTDHFLSAYQNDVDKAREAAIAYFNKMII